MIRLVDLIARALAGRPVHVDIPLPPTVQVRTSTLVPLLGGFLSGMRRSAAAVALGRTILVHPSATIDARLLRHELTHVAQWRRAPLTFPFRYIGAHIRHGYGANPYEVEARAAERPPRPTGEAHDVPIGDHD